ncbi:MAG TPA: hypothetical protein VKE69_12545 [Planctomycetota bacterium]|nr:hypothetical protein [Planctomycetota bacterium]
MSRSFAVLAALALACSTHASTNGSSAAAAESPVASKPATGASATQDAVSDEDRQAVELADSIQKDVERIHGLEFLRPVKKGVYDRERLAKFLAKQMEKEGKAKIATDQHVMQIFGLLPPEYDLEHEMTDLLLEQIGGFYDPDTRELYILRGFQGLVAKILMAHELCHALDDQHFDLKAKMDHLEKDFADDQDRSFAMRAVVEGSATELMNAYGVDAMAQSIRKGEAVDFEELMKQGVGGIPMDKASSAPPILMRPLIDAYMEGAQFLARGKGMMGMGRAKKKDVRRAFEDPPLSSEQILHPNKYWKSAERDDPQEVRLPDLSGALGEGWKRSDSNVLGELGVAVLTAPPAPESKPSTAPATQEETMKKMMETLTGEKTTEAASGWDGDRYDFYSGPQGAEALVWASVWDSEADALELLAALRVPEGVSLVTIHPAKDRVLALFGRNLPASISTLGVLARADAGMTVREIHSATEGAPSADTDGGK